MSSNRTAQFLGGEPGLSASLGVASVHSLWGGFIMRVGGDGVAAVRLFAHGAQHERRFVLQLSPDETRALFGLAIGGDLISAVRPPRDYLIPDESAYTVALSNGSQTWSLQVWEHDPPPPTVAAVIAALRALERRTAALTPVYEGPSRGEA